MPKVSVIIPIYGVEKYIEKCARSLFEQTLDDVEYIFINDCTPDKSIEILQHVLEDYPMRKYQVSILHNEKNLGQGGTRKRGILTATGDYVIHCDSDDWVELDWLESLYSVALYFHADIVLADFFTYNSDNSQKVMSQSKVCDKKGLLIDLLVGTRVGCLWGGIVARSIVQHNAIIWPSWNFTEDLSLMFQYVNFSKKIKIIESPFYHYRNNEESITRIKDAIKMRKNMNDYFCTQHIIAEVAKKCGIWNLLEAISLHSCFLAKNRILTLYDDDREATKAWLEFHPELGLRSLLKARIRKIQKLYILIILLRIFPFVNCFFNLRNKLDC